MDKNTLNDGTILQKDIQSMKHENETYFKQSKKQSFFEKNTYTNKDFEYCLRNIPRFVSKNDDALLRSNYEYRRSAFMKQENIETISNHFIQDILDVLHKNNLQLKNEKICIDDLKHFIYMYSKY